MKKIIGFRTHSFVDVITNSSSELFIGKAKNDSDIIKDLLQEMLDLYNKTSEYQYDFDSCFGYIGTIGEKRGLESLLDTFFYHGVPYGLRKLLPSFPEYKYSNNSDLSYSEQREIEKKRMEEYKNNLSSKVLKEINSFFYIESNSYNSIPYELFDMIENLFKDSGRLHLG